MSKTYDRRNTEYRAKSEHKGINPKSTQFAISKTLTFVDNRIVAEQDFDTPDLHNYRSIYEHTRDYL